MDANIKAGLEALGDATRMAIFHKLSVGPMAVGDLAAGMPVSRPAVSQHLRVLKDAGLVSDIHAGTRRMYQLNPEGIARLSAHFDQMWSQAMNSFANSVKADSVPSKREEKEHGRDRGGSRSQ